MIEMLGVLAIIGVLSVGGIMGYSKAMFRYKINKTIEQISYMATNVRTAFINQKDYDGLVPWAPFLKKMHIVPEDMWKEGKDFPQNVWDGDVDLCGNCDDYNSFKFWYYNIPEEACIELVTHDWKNAEVKIIEIQSNFDSSVVIPPAKIDDAVILCDDGSTDVSFTFVNASLAEGGNWKSKLDYTAELLSGL